MQTLRSRVMEGNGWRAETRNIKEMSRTARAGGGRHLKEENAKRNADTIQASASQILDLPLIEIFHSKILASSTQ